ncbi:MAG: zf-HC2 domain-containing protein [Vicinamibacterales bacterium]
MDQHFDAERLAAFADGSLSREQRAAAEAHAADCPRCLHLLAAMARTEDATAPHAHSWWRMPVGLRWGVPLLAGATALALWINVRPRPAMETPAVEVSQPAVVSPEASPSRPASPEPSPQAEVDALKSQAVEKRQVATPAQTKARADQQSLRTEQARAKEAPSASASAPVLAPLSDRDLRQLPAPTVPRPAAPVAAPAASPANAAPVPPPAQPDTSARFRTDEALAETVTVTRSADVTLEVVSPDASRRWRVAGKAIQRSTDGGKTWSTERVPLQSEIVAGASPSPLVAWFVGRGGYILLTTGTNQWRRAIFPEAADLSSVRARSERDADVTTSDGRVFATADGGRSWSRR